MNSAHGTTTWLIVSVTLNSNVSVYFLDPFNRRILGAVPFTYPSLGSGNHGNRPGQRGQERILTYKWITIMHNNKDIYIHIKCWGWMMGEQQGFRYQNLFHKCGSMHDAGNCSFDHLTLNVRLRSPHHLRFDSNFVVSVDNICHCFHATKDNVNNFVQE